MSRNKILWIWRKVNRITQGKVANKLGVSKQYYCAIENQQTVPNIRMMKKLMRVTGLSADIIIGGMTDVRYRD